MLFYVFDAFFIKEWLQGTKVNETQEFREPFIQNSRFRSRFSSFTVDIICYRGKHILERYNSFTDKDPGEFVNIWRVMITTNTSLLQIGMFSTLCSVTADLSHIETPPKISPRDLSIYYTVHFDVIFYFGLTELKAFVAWKEDVSPILVFQKFQ